MICLLKRNRLDKPEESHMLKGKRQKVPSILHAVLLEILEDISKTLLSLDLGEVVPENRLCFNKTDRIYIIQD